MRRQKPDNQDDSGSETDAVAAAATAANVQAQPVAAAVITNTIINTPPAATAAAATNMAIGSSAAASATSALPIADAKTVASSQNAGDPLATSDASNASAATDANSGSAAQDTVSTSDAKTSAAGQDAKAAASAGDAKTIVAAQDAKIAVPAQPAKVADASHQAERGRQANVATATLRSQTQLMPMRRDDSQALNGSAMPQAQTRADSDTIITSQSGGSAATHIDALAATPASDAGGSSSAQSGWNAAKAATEGLPNFGIIANQAAPAVAAATPGTAAAATVPIAGLAVAIASRAQAGSSQFDIRLDPPELGRIDVRLDVDRDGQVTSHVTVDRADTLQLLQSQQPQLERALEQAGLKTADNGLQFTLRDQSFAGQNSGSGRRAAERGAARHSRRRGAGDPGNANLFPRRPRQRRRYPRVNSNGFFGDEP